MLRRLAIGLVLLLQQLTSSLSLEVERGEIMHLPHHLVVLETLVAVEGRVGIEQAQDHLEEAHPQSQQSPSLFQPITQLQSEAAALEQVQLAHGVQMALILFLAQSPRPAAAQGVLNRPSPEIAGVQAVVDVDQLVRVGRELQIKALLEAPLR
jgi:hypothetical protein